MILFRKVKDAYGWLSNMSPHRCMEYRTAEGFFQAQRFNDLDIREEIRACTSPMSAKMTAKKHADKMVIVPRSEDDLRLMSMVLRMKLASNPDLVEKLLATGDELIVEDVQARQNESGLFWGAVVENGVIVKGENHLGRLWMELRAKLRSQS